MTGHNTSTALSAAAFRQQDEQQQQQRPGAAAAAVRESPEQPVLPFEVLQRDRFVHLQQHEEEQQMPAPAALLLQSVATAWQELQQVQQSHMQQQLQGGSHAQATARGARLQV